MYMYHKIGLKQTHGIKNVTLKAAKKILGVGVFWEEWYIIATSAHWLDITKKKLTADMSSDWLIADVGTVISDTKWLYNIYSLTIVQKRPTHTWGYQDPIPYNSQIFTLCCSRKYPYPSHGRFFFKLTPTPPLQKFHFSVILLFRILGFWNPPPPWNFR